MNDIVDLNVNFHFKSIKDWFNDNYFICLYDLNDNYITCFDSIESGAIFFNRYLKNFYRSLRNGFIVYNHKKFKLLCFEKEKEEKIEKRIRK